MKCGSLNLKNNKLTDRYSNLSFKSSNKNGNSFYSKNLENTTYFNSKNNIGTRNSLMSAMTGFIYTNKNKEAILNRKPIRIKFFEKFNNTASKTLSNQKRSINNEYNFSYNKTISSFKNSNKNLKELKKYNIKPLNHALKLLRINNSITKLDKNNKQFYMHSLLNLNGNTGTYSYSNTERNIKYQPNISFGKFDIFMNYIKSKERLTYFKKFLNHLEFECKNNDEEKTYLVYKLYLKNLRKLILCYFRTKDRYLTQLKMTIEEETEKNTKLTKEVLELKREIFSLTIEKSRYLHDINLYKDVKNFLHKIRNYILASTEKKVKEDKITPIRKLFITEQGEFNDENYLEILISVFKQKFVDNFSRVELPYRDYLIFDNMIKDKIAQLLIEQANIIKDQEPMKEEFNIFVQNFEISEKKFNEYYNKEYKSIQKKISQVKKDNLNLNKSLSNLKNKYIINKKISNSNIENKIMNIFDCLVNEKIIIKTPEEDTKQYKDKYFNSKEIFYRLYRIDEAFVYLINEKKSYLKEEPEKYKEEQKKLNERKKLESVLNAKIKEIKEKKLKEKKLYDSINKICIKGVKKDYISMNIPEHIKNKLRPKNKVKGNSIDISF